MELCLGTLFYLTTRVATLFRLFHVTAGVATHTVLPNWYQSGVHHLYCNMKKVLEMFSLCSFHIRSTSVLHSSHCPMTLCLDPEGHSMIIVQSLVCYTVITICFDWPHVNTVTLCCFMNCGNWHAVGSNFVSESVPQNLSNTLNISK